jgi:hypothetical protein
VSYTCAAGEFRTIVEIESDGIVLSPSAELGVASAHTTVPPAVGRWLDAALAPDEVGVALAQAEINRITANAIDPTGPTRI